MGRWKGEEGSSSILLAPVPRYGPGDDGGVEVVDTTTPVDTQQKRNDKGEREVLPGANKPKDKHTGLMKQTYILPKHKRPNHRLSGDIRDVDTVSSSAGHLTNDDRTLLCSSVRRYTWRLSKEASVAKRGFST